MKSVIIKKTIANALSARKKHILAVRSFKYKKGCKEWQDLTDTADFLDGLINCFRECCSFSINFVYSDGHETYV